MAEQTDQEKWLQYAEEYCAPLEDWTKVPVVSDEDDINETMSIPGVKYSADPTLTNNAKPENFIQLHLATLFRKINAMLQYVREAINSLATLKTQTENARDTANGKASLAEEKASLANQKATLANDKALYAERQGDRAKAFSDHPCYIGDDGYIYFWDETHDNGDGTLGASVRSNKMIIGFNELTEEQKQSMIDQFFASLTFASVETCEAIVDALT